MKANLHHPKNWLSANRLFLCHFLQIFLAMAIIFVAFTMYTYRNSRQIIEREFTNSNFQDLQNLSGYVDSVLTETKYMISTLIANENMHFFYASPAPETIWSDYSRQIQTQLTTLRYSRESIETIYLYSEASNSVYSSVSHMYLDNFEDRYWLNCLDSDSYGFSIFPYAMRNSFPFVICVAKEFTVNNYRCAIAIMINLSKIPILTTIDGNSYQNAYMISDNDEIIYRHRQDSLKESLDSTTYMAQYDPSVIQKVYLSPDSANTYSFAQLHSSEYPWSYVLVTHLQNYTARLSNQHAILLAASTVLIVFAVLFALFFSMRSLKPIQDIRDFLESPEMMHSSTLTASADIKYIAGRITQYIQTNQLLKDELQERLHLLTDSQILALQSQINPHFLSNTLNLMYIQATDALGYDHKLPLMITKTSALIRYAIEPAKMVSLKTEISQTAAYLSILDQRYDKNLTVRNEIDDNTLDAMVPRLFLQPIIENAVFHGFSDQEDTECVLTIRCRRFQPTPLSPTDSSTNTAGHASKSFILVQIQDNGQGISREHLDALKQTLRHPEVSVSSKGIGLRNVVQRMNLIYSDEFSLNIESTLGTGTCFTLIFPYVCS